MCVCFNRRKSEHFSKPTNKALAADIRDYKQEGFEFHVLEAINLKGVPKEEWGAILWERETIGSKSHGRRQAERRRPIM